MSMTVVKIKDQETLKREISSSYQKNPGAVVLIPRNTPAVAGPTGDYEISTSPSCWGNWELVNGVVLDGKWQFFKIPSEPGELKLFKLQ